MALTYDLATQQRPRTQQLATRAPARANPWQFILGMLVLLPTVVGLALYVAAFMKHGQNLAALLLVGYGTEALTVAGFLAVVWLLVGAITWQIKEAHHRS